MKKNNINSKNGFTIIEVILVLAIGSLIILMALVALPSLQSSQRDQQRKSDYSMLETAITNYSSANRGKLPEATASLTIDTQGSWLKNYIKDSWADPSAGVYTVTIENRTTAFTGAPDLTTGQVYIYTSTKCNGAVPEYDASLGQRRYAIYAFLESGTYCQAN